MCIFKEKSECILDLLSISQSRGKNAKTFRWGIICCQDKTVRSVLGALNKLTISLEESVHITCNQPTNPLLPLNYLCNQSQNVSP